MLDFWATWCGPCRRALPSLQEFANWASESGKPIKVCAVNVWQHEPSDAEKTEAVRRFWSQAGYTMPALLDLDDKVAAKFGVRVIPTTFLIDPQGRIASIHTGFSADMVERLKAEAEEALEQSQ